MNIIHPGPHVHLNAQGLSLLSKLLFFCIPFFFFFFPSHIILVPMVTTDDLWHVTSSPHRLLTAVMYWFQIYASLTSALDFYLLDYLPADLMMCVTALYCVSGRFVSGQRIPIRGHCALSVPWKHIYNQFLNKFTNSKTKKSHLQPVGNVLPQNKLIKTQPKRKR